MKCACGETLLDYDPVLTFLFMGKKTGNGYGNFRTENQRTESTRKMFKGSSFSGMSSIMSSVSAFRV